MIRFFFYKVRHEYDEDLPKHLKKILDKSQIGDWFVIYQLRYHGHLVDFIFMFNFILI